MRVRATRDALSLRLDGNESPQELRRVIEELPALPLEVEVNGLVGGEALEALLEAARARGLAVTLRPPRGERYVPYTEVVGRTLRSGQRVESPGTVVVLGDVNPGAEVVAGGDVIVVGKLRGLAHAGASGNLDATVWALALEAQQLRIAHLVARAPEEGFKSQGPERARVDGERIVLEPWGRR
ncbi:septum site-determining protein MinC [Marinithermus hydrothermalis]|uniref:Probable septum site-determining protein MinC n=1 Tax=Marinithermus hydrothermalis (strain DSM 14884 / JCM 11576 / T1) TaxID=869210 RepID=F2NLV8_MARHT|nr:septum site-determining protein MinC [Marinithermus hydrothermalis]AEB11215.1 septum site-determining protein minC [Marinithermus hydrothermalis DSM 14884]